MEGHMFPSSWPKGCPPEDAIAAQGVVYRIVRSNPPTPSDFASLHEQGRPVTNKPCESAGLSVFWALSDALHCAEKFPYLGELIALGRLEPLHGMLKPTPRRDNSHTTWWPAEGIARHTVFSIASQ
jgi:hypothetical protein